MDMTKETIGNVTLNYEFYKGTDTYSDGDIEDTLLDIVKNAETEADILERLTKDDDWAILYHLSPIRHNVLEWYDFDPKASVLEIGAGCGAISGLFCQKTERVVAIDLSKRRSTINAYRNKAYDNLEIIVGNFQDIQITEKFDYVSLIGVLEYAIYYMNSKQPFLDMLKKVRTFLKPGGKLLLAIENKYGMKYWAGATEDHTGNCFDGIEGYPGVNRVRTFSRMGLEQLLKQAGFTENEFYFPVPDYKMPLEIYSRSNMPKAGTIKRMTPAYDRERLALFDEVKAFDSICQEGMFSIYANSFVVISGDGTVAEESTADTEETATQTKVVHAEPLMTKYNSQRKPEFQVKTTIIRDNGKRYAVKSPMVPQAEAHLRNMKHNFNLASRLYQDMQILVGEQIMYHDTPSIRFPFVPGTAMDESLDFGLQDLNMLMSDIRTLIDHLTDVPDYLYQEFEMTDGFQAMFPGVDPGPVDAMSICNLDAIPSNFIIRNGQTWCLDYEWMVDFPVPIEFIQYRIALYIYAEHQAYLAKRVTLDHYFVLLDFDLEKSALYQKMEDCFQEYVHGEDRKYLYLQQYEKRVYAMDDPSERVNIFARKEQEIERLQRDLESRNADIEYLNNYIYELKDCIRHPVKGWMKYRKKKKAKARES